MAKISTRVTRTHSLELRTRDILELASHLDGVDIPANARVTVRVPGGGDWSNMDLDIAESPVVIEWVVEEET